jgi:hypothetical protein
MSFDDIFSALRTAQLNNLKVINIYLSVQSSINLIIKYLDLLRTGAPSYENALHLWRLSSELINFGVE